MEKSKDIFNIFYFINQNQMQKNNNNNDNNSNDNSNNNNINNNYDNDNKCKNSNDNIDNNNIDDKFDDEGSYGKMSTVLTDNADSRYISEDPMNVHGFTSDLSVIKEVRTKFLML